MDERWETIAKQFGLPLPVNGSGLEEYRILQVVKNWRQTGHRYAPMYNIEKARDNVDVGVLAEMIAWNENVVSELEYLASTDKVALLRDYVDGEIEPGSRLELFLYNCGLLDVGNNGKRMVLTRYGKRTLGKGVKQ
jgi:hypothetical protein